jgi:hypothetical protein
MMEKSGATFADFLSKFMSEGMAEAISWVVGILVVGASVYSIIQKRKTGRWPWEKKEKK